MRNCTPKRAKQEREYNKERIEFIEEKKGKKGFVHCIFCQRSISGNPDIHHAFGRDDERIFDKKHWMIAHNECHVHQYHSMSWKKIWWWGDYIARIKYEYPKVYEKEIIKMSKNGNK